MENLKTWLLASNRRGLIRINQIEKQSGIPKSTIQNWLDGERGLPAKHIPAIQKTLKILGYKPD